MIGLNINGEYADLRPDERISFKLMNPLFEEGDTLKGSYTLPFNLAGSDSSPRNASLFKNPHVLENTEVYPNLDAGIDYDGIPYRKGKIRAKTVSGDRITTNFIFGLSTISDEFKTKKIRDIIREEVVIDAAHITKRIFIKPAGAATTPYRILVNDRFYEGNTLTDLASAINTDTTEPRAQATVITSGNTPQGATPNYIEIKPVTNPTDPLSPLSVKPADDNSVYSNPGGAFVGYKWYVEAYDMTSYYDAFKNFLQPYQEGDYPTEAVRFPVIFNVDPYDENAAVVGFEAGAGVFGTTKGTEYVNMLNSLGLVTNNANIGVFLNTPFMTLSTNSIQPFVRLKWLLQQIAEYFGVGLEGDWYDDVDTGNMLVDNAMPLDVPMPFIGNTKFVFWKRSFNLADLVPDLTAPDLLKGLMKRYNVGVYLNEETNAIRLVKRERIARAVDYNDITNQSSPIDPIDNLSMPGIKLSTDYDKADKLAVADERIIGDPDTEQKSIISALPQNQTITQVNNDPGNVTGPRVSRKIAVDFPCRIFYYSGIVDNGSWSYPSASINATGYNDQFDGPNGLYEKLWKRWITYQLNRRSVQLTASLPFRTLRYFDWEKKVRFDRSNYLVKSIAFDMMPTGLSASKVELYLQA